MQNYYGCRKKKYKVVRGKKLIRIDRPDADFHIMFGFKKWIDKKIMQFVILIDVIYLV